MRSLSLARNAVALTTLACLALSSAGYAQTLYQQPANLSGVGNASQVFPDQPRFTIYSFDNFTVTGNGWDITQVTAFGVEHGDPTFNTAVSLAFTTSPNAAAIGTTYAGTEIGSNLVFTQPVHLNPGAYFLTAYVTRLFTGGGQWLFGESAPVNSSSYYEQNPGGGFGFGTAPLQPSSGADLAFQINGTLTPAAVPEPGSVALLIGLTTTGAGFFARRRKQAI